jgi:hypothetical protein
LIYRGLAKDATAEPLAKTMIRLEAVAARLESVAKATPQGEFADRDDAARAARLDRKRPRRG